MCEDYIELPVHICVAAHRILVRIAYAQKPPLNSQAAGPRRAVGNVSSYRCVSDCRSRCREFDPGLVPSFRGIWPWTNFYGHSSPFRWFIQEGLLSVTSESVCTNYWLTVWSSLPRKNVVKWTDRPAMTIAVDLGRKANKQTNSQAGISNLASGIYSSLSLNP